MIYEAAKFAIEKHSEQKYGEHPYVYHLSQVVRVLEWASVTSEETLAAGWLHDTIEDTDTIQHDLVFKFSENVANIVLGCTGLGRNRRERTADTLAKIRLAGNQYPFEVKLVKMADRIANMENSRDCRPDLYKMYVSELDSFIEACKCEHVYSDVKQNNIAYTLLLKRLLEA